MGDVIQFKSKTAYIGSSHGIDILFDDKKGLFKAIAKTPEVTVEATRVVDAIEKINKLMAEFKGRKAYRKK